MLGRVCVVEWSLHIVAVGIYVLPVLRCKVSGGRLHNEEEEQREEERLRKVNEVTSSLQ